jgi:predicted HTH transcriptional regulator
MPFIPASTLGGRIYIGISNDIKITGIEIQGRDWLDKLQQRLMNHVYENVKPTPELSITPLSLREKVVIKIAVQKGLEPVYYLRGVPYIRKLTTSRPATPDDVKNKHLRYFIETGEIGSKRASNK